MININKIDIESKYPDLFRYLTFYKSIEISNDNEKKLLDEKNENEMIKNSFKLIKDIEYKAKDADTSLHKFLEGKL